MQFIDFRDHCVITRDNGGRDEWDNPLDPETIYDGPCLYEEGGTSYTRVFTVRNPAVFLPGVDVQVRINDAVTVTTEFDREIKSIVKIVRDINMPWRTNVKITRIELKQAQGD
jgi:hypothetical protein